MNEDDEQLVLAALTLRAQAGDADAARILFAEKAKHVRPINFHECQTLDALKVEFESYMGQSDITKAESDHAAKAFDRIFKTIVARDGNTKKAASNLLEVSGIMLVPTMDVQSWEVEAERSQRELKATART